MQAAISARLGEQPAKRSPRAAMILVLTTCGLFWAVVAWVVLKLF